MLCVGPYEFKIAESADELDQVHRLNYRTFVQEIPQHRDSGTGALVDKFHDKNTYLICMRVGKLVGMLSAHGQPPFSVSDRLPDPSILTRPGIIPLEVRLLAIEPSERRSTLVGGLVWSLHQHARATGHTHFVISGVVEQRDFYEHMGFMPLGPAVGSGRASYIPMWATLEDVEATLEWTMRLWARRLERQANAG